jgi:hypothetical protein
VASVDDSSENLALTVCKSGVVEELGKIKKIYQIQVSQISVPFECE